MRWEKGGKSGYSPAGIMDWNAIRNARPADRKKVARQTRSLSLLTDEAIRKHLEGKSTVGIYPLLPDETCWFLAVDFDKSAWRQDAVAFLETCRRYGVPASLERSRSGNGGHVWLFFDRPVPAVDARRLGAAILTRTTESRHEVGLDSYDRFFPNQDTMPRGGFGNLIALPLQKGPRKLGNSVFVDQEIQPLQDQWQWLSAIQRVPPICCQGSLTGWPRKEMSRSPVRSNRGQRCGRSVAVAALQEAAGTNNHWPISGERADCAIQPGLHREAGTALSHTGSSGSTGGVPESGIHKAQAMRVSTYGKPRIISCAENFPEHIGLPRGCLQDAVDLFRSYGVSTEIRDERVTGRSLSIEFQGTLLPAQQEAAARLRPMTSALSARRPHSATLPGRLANRVPEGQHPRSGSPPATLGSMARSPGDFLDIPRRPSGKLEVVRRREPVK